MNENRMLFAIACSLFSLIGDALPVVADDQKEDGPDYPEELVKSAPLVEWKIRSGDVACAESIKMLGLPESVLAKSSAKLVTLVVNNTPYLSEQLVGTPLWHVVIQDWPKKIKYVTPLDVYVDPVKGRVLELRTRWPEGEPPIAPEPSAESATRQMSGRGPHDVFHGFPESLPKVSFLDALDALSWRTQAKQVVARCVMWSVVGGKCTEPRPVWVITLRGVKLPRRPESAARYSRHYIVDAEIGRVRSHTNIPKPDKPDPGVAEDN